MPTAERDAGRPCFLCGDLTLISWVDLKTDEKRPCCGDRAILLRDNPEKREMLLAEVPGVQ